MIETLLRNAARARYRSILGAGLRAGDAPAAVSRQEGARRVLLLATGVSSGWGVATHQLGLTGLLRDRLQAIAGSPFDVHLVGDEVMNVSTAADWLGDRGQQAWDAAVIAVGVNDAVRLIPLPQWEREYTALVDRLRADLPTTAPLVLAGLPPISSIAPLQSPLGAAVAAHAQRLNSTVQRIALDTDRTVFASLPPKATEPGRPWGSPEAYRPWAEVLAAEVLRVLPLASVPGGQPREADVQPLTRQLVDRAYTGGTVGLQAIVQEAEQRFGVGAVLVNILDGDRAWVAADSRSGAIKSLPRHLTYCDTTMRQGQLHVPDAHTDARFRDNVLLELTGLTSYAGTVVHGPDGNPVGTVCLFNGATAHGIDPAALAALGREVEEELARPAPPAAPVTPEPHVPSTAASTAPSTGIAGRLFGAARLRAQGPAFNRAAQAGRAAPNRLEPVRVPGPDPLRVLLFGGDYAVGLGAPTRRAAMDGAIADLLHERTGRGVTVDNWSDTTWRLPELAERLHAASPGQYDLVVWTPPFAEASRYATMRPWCEAVQAMLARLQQTPTTGTVLLGIPALQGPAPIAVLARWRAGQIEQVLRRAADRSPRTLVVDPPPVALTDVHTVDGSEVYLAAAQRALPAMLEVLHVRLLTSTPPALATGVLEAR